MGREMIAVGVLLALGACGGDDGGGPISAASSGTTASAGDSTAVSSEETNPMPTTASDSEGVEPFLEVGWGMSDFNAFDGELPISLGAQGLNMFSLPLRGSGFHNPPDPSFDNPDMPMFEAWVDIEGYSGSPNGHFNEVTDYPALFYPSVSDGAVLEGPAVWMTLPDGVSPEDILGLTASLHAELLDRDGLRLTDDHELVITMKP